MTQRLLAVVALLATLPVGLVAQHSRPDSATELVSAFRIAKGVDYARVEDRIRRVLKQEVPSTALERKTLADGLLQIALTYEVPGRRVNAVTMISIAGGSVRGVPYDGALNLLVDIYNRAEDVGVRGVALSGLARIADRPDAFRFLRTIIEQEPPPAFRRAPARAIHAVLEEAGDEGRAFIRKIHKEGTVKHPDTKRYLDILAKRNFRYP